MDQDLNRLREESLAAITNAAALPALNDVRVEVLGRKGKLTDLMKTLGGLSPDERKARGAALNTLKDELTAALDARAQALEGAALDQRLAAERIDVTLPPRPLPDGRIHPISQTIDEMVAIFGEMGFVVAEGPRRRGRFLQLHPAQHPARASGAAEPRHVLHEDAESRGRLGRRAESPAHAHVAGADPHDDEPEAADPHHRARPHFPLRPRRHALAQLPPDRGLAIDTNLHMGHLKGCLIEFVRAFFDVPDLPVRFRPSHFPFTEPSAEMDIGCSRSGGELKLGAGGDWLEILGSGMVHPKVIANCGLDPEVWQGFAFGMGIERAGDAQIRHPRSAHDVRRRPALAASLRLRADRRALDDGRARRDEVHPRLAQGASRHQRVARRDHARLDRYRARARIGRGSRGQARAVHRRLRRRGAPAPRCRPAARVHRRYRQREESRWCAARPTRAPA
jgi:phenylalanyl-tRNA synthetase alpha chain